MDSKGSIANLKDRLARVKQKQQQRLEQLQALRDMYKAKAQGNSSEPDTLVIENQAQQVDELTVEASTIAEENPDVSTFENWPSLIFASFFYYTLTKLSFKLTRGKLVGLGRNLGPSLERPILCNKVNYHL